jgi:hypothetical protein
MLADSFVPRSCFLSSVTRRKLTLRMAGATTSTEATSDVFCYAMECLLFTLLLGSPDHVLLASNLELT